MYQSNNGIDFLSFADCRKTKPSMKNVAINTILFRILPVICSIKPYENVPITIAAFSVTSYKLK